MSLRAGRKTSRRFHLPATVHRYLGRFAPNAVYDDTPGPWPTGLESGASEQPLLPVLAGEQNMDPNDPNLVLPGAAGTRYYHMDLTGSVIMTTGPDGTGGEGDVSPVSLSYTAFGELVVWDPDAGDGGAWIIGGPLGDGSAGAPAGYPRYQYCGTWGYETGRDAIEAAGGRAADPELLALAGANPTLPKIKLMHVGARWYDPAIGRFVQTDSIGFIGSLNKYSYATETPTSFIDPDGRQIALSMQLTESGIRHVLIAAVFGTTGLNAVGHALTFLGAEAGVVPIAIGARTGSISHAAAALGLSQEQVRRAIHNLKRTLGLGGRYNVEIDTATGDVYVNDELIGNIFDELGRCGLL